MSARRRISRWAALSALASALLVRHAPDADAQLLVIDGVSIGQAVAQAVQVAQQLQAMTAQVEALRRAARQLDPRSYQSVQNLLAGNDVNYMALIRDVRSMGYTVERVNARFRQLYPDDRAVKNMTPRQAETTAREMNQELYESSLVAARAQTTLRGIEDNNAAARNILSQSEGNDSQVAQLQSALQMLALMHDNLVNINRLISSSGRISSNQAVSAVTMRRIENERAAQMTNDYAKSEAIPEVDSRLLHPW